MTDTKLDESLRRSLDALEASYGEVVRELEARAWDVRVEIGLAIEDELSLEEDVTYHLVYGPLPRAQDRVPRVFVQQTIPVGEDKPPLRQSQEWSKAPLHLKLAAARELPRLVQKLEAEMRSLGDVIAQAAEGLAPLPDSIQRFDASQRTRRARVETQLLEYWQSATKLLELTDFAANTTKLHTDPITVELADQEDSPPVQLSYRYARGEGSLVLDVADGGQLRPADFAAADLHVKLAAAERLPQLVAAVESWGQEMVDGAERGARELRKTELEARSMSALHGERVRVLAKELRARWQTAVETIEGLEYIGNAEVRITDGGGDLGPLLLQRLGGHARLRFERDGRKVVWDDLTLDERIAAVRKLPDLWQLLRVQVTELLPHEAQQGVSTLSGHVEQLQREVQQRRQDLAKRRVATLAKLDSLWEKARELPDGVPGALEVKLDTGEGAGRYSVAVRSYRGSWEIAVYQYLVAGGPRETVSYHELPPDVKLQVLRSLPVVYTKLVSQGEEYEQRLHVSREQLTLLVDKLERVSAGGAREGLGLRREFETSLASAVRSLTEAKLGVVGAVVLDLPAETLGHGLLDNDHERELTSAKLCHGVFDGNWRLNLLLRVKTRHGEADKVVALEERLGKLSVAMKLAVARALPDLVELLERRRRSEIESLVETQAGGTIPAKSRERAQAHETASQRHRREVQRRLNLVAQVAWGVAAEVELEAPLGGEGSWPGEGILWSQLGVLAPVGVPDRFVLAHQVHEGSWAMVLRQEKGAERIAFPLDKLDALSPGLVRAVAAGLPRLVERLQGSLEQEWESLHGVDFSRQLDALRVVELDYEAALERSFAALSKGATEVPLSLTDAQASRLPLLGAKDAAGRPDGDFVALLKQKKRSIPVVIRRRGGKERVHRLGSLATLDPTVGRGLTQLAGSLQQTTHGEVVNMLRELQGRQADVKRWEDGVTSQMRQVAAQADQVLASWSWHTPVSMPLEVDDPLHPGRHSLEFRGAGQPLVVKSVVAGDDDPREARLTELDLTLCTAALQALPQLVDVIRKAASARIREVEDLNLALRTALIKHLGLLEAAPGE